MNKGVYSFSTGFVDFPDKYAMTIYFSGCNLNCDFCHNRHILQAAPTISKEYALHDYYALKEVVPSMGVVFSGGEPTLNKDFYWLYNKIEDSKSIHTNGYRHLSNMYFDSIILGLKPFNNREYIEMVKTFLQEHTYIPTKQIRYIDDIYIKEYEEVLNEIWKLAVDLNWNIVGVNDFRKEF